MPTTGFAAPNIRILRQAVDLIARVDDAVYARPSPLAPGGSVGKHLRHCLDFYECFLRGAPTGMVDYTGRNRDARVETQRHVACQRLREIIARLESLTMGTHRTLLVRDEEESLTEGGWSGSTVQRELQFLLSHTLHHCALIGVLLRSREVEPDEEFGVAPSTIRHRRESRACRIS